MTAWNSSKHADHQKAHAERKRAGLKAVTPAWQGLSASKVQEMSRHAFRVVTWRYRSAEASDGQALRQDLERAFAALLERSAGRHEAAAWLDSWAADMPPTWTAQYPLYAVPQSGEAA